MTETMPEGIQKLQQYIITLNDQMINFEKTGKYVDADTFKVQLNQAKKELEKRKLIQMQNKQAQEQEELDKSHQNQMDQFNSFWDKKIKDFNDQGRRLENQLTKHHNQQYQKTKEELEKTLPIKHKQSSQLLNLKKMQQYMAKQKNYTEANKVQQKIAALDKLENQAWLNSRSLKIQTNLNLLKSKQANQLAALRKKFLTGNDQQTKDRISEHQRLTLKYNNAKRDLTRQQQKERLAFKGQFRSKVNLSSTGSRSKN